MLYTLIQLHFQIMQEDWFKQQPNHCPITHAYIQEKRVQRARSTLTLDFLTFMGLSWNFNVLLMLSFGVGIQKCFKQRHDGSQRSGICLHWQIIKKSTILGKLSTIQRTQWDHFA